MNAFWKKMAIPGYTTGLSAKDKRFTDVKKMRQCELFYTTPKQYYITFDSLYEA